MKEVTKTIQDFGYQFNPATGNLTWRKDNTRNLKESFGYDELNRLTRFGDKTMGYDVKGNITHKKSVGVFDYTSNKPYAIDLISTGEGEDQVLERNQDISYNAMMRPSSISEGAKTTNFYYDADASRIKMQTKQGDVEELTRYYIGSQYEYDSTPEGTEERLFLDGDAYEAPTVFVKKNQNAYLYYLGRDYLGSITYVLDADGNLLQELSYDAWGRLRKPENHELHAQGSEVIPILGGRGYTGHEHLTHYGLINMNARLYDLVVGRFLSPDPYIQAPDFSQNFNRYSYALNNPLLYTDPNGEWALVDDAIAAAVGGTINLVSNLVQGNVHNIGQGFAYFGVGAAGGVVSIYGGPIAGGAVIAGGNSILTQGFTNGFGNISWNNVAMDATMGALTGAASAALGTYFQQSITSVYSNVASPVLREMLMQGSVGIATGFTVNTAMAKINGASWGDALSSGVDGAVWGGISGFGKGIGDGFKYAKNNNISPWSGKAKGIEIAGSNHTEVLPTQDWLDKKQVDFYKDQIRDKQPIKAIRAYEVNGKIYIEDGHHRYAAYKALGVEPKITIHKLGGPVGLRDWSDTTYSNPK